MPFSQARRESTVYPKKFAVPRVYRNAPFKKCLTCNFLPEHPGRSAVAAFPGLSKSRLPTDPVQVRTVSVPPLPSESAVLVGQRNTALVSFATLRLHGEENRVVA